MKQSPLNKNSLTDADLQLYLSGALPWGKAALLWLLALVNRELRQRIRSLKSQNELFLKKEYPKLREKLAGAWRQKVQERAPVSTETGNASISGLPGWGRWRLAAGMAFLLAAGFCVYIVFQVKNGLPEPVQYAAKGTSLGVHVYAKNAAAKRVENYQVQLLAGDTLQVVPVGEGNQYLVIYGWDRQQGLTQLFPRSQDPAALVSKDSLPPALVLDHPGNMKLVCISSPHSLDPGKIGTLLSEEPYVSMETAPQALLHKDVYVQIYSVRGVKP